jgi:hypothetical protein
MKTRVAYFPTTFEMNLGALEKRKVIFFTLNQQKRFSKTCKLKFESVFARKIGARDILKNRFKQLNILGAKSLERLSR